MPHKDLAQRVAYQQQYRQKHREKYRAYYQKYWKRHSVQQRQQNQERRIEALIRYSLVDYPICAHCGITDVDVLCIDHINGGGNKHHNEVGWGGKFYLWLKNNSYPKGYQVLCANCNLKKEIQRRKANCFPDKKE